MTVCERIDKLIKEQGISRRKLALMAGISPSSLQSAMARNTTISYDMLIPISNALNIPAEILAGKTPNLDSVQEQAITGSGKPEYSDRKEDLQNRMQEAFSALNQIGQKVACERVEELAKIGDYKRK